MRLRRPRLRARYPGDGQADAQRRLDEARRMQAQVKKAGERNVRLAQEARRLAKRNRIAEIVYHGLTGDGR